MIGEKDGKDQIGIDEGDALDALKALGIREREAREALKKVPEDIVDVSERVRYVLKSLGSKK